MRSALAHPLAQGRQFDVVKRSVQYALYSIASPDLRLFPWLGGMNLIGMAGDSGYFRNYLHEFADMGFVAHFLQKDDLFLDGGANIGTWSMLAAGHGGASVISVEPAVQTVAVLRANVALNGFAEGIRVVQAALADGEGTAAMGTRGLTNAVRALDQMSASDTVVRLTTLALILGDQIPALIKLDLEGYEIKALSGAGALLHAKKVLGWCIEANTRAEAIDLYTVMSRAGYVNCYYDPLTRTLQTERPEPCWQNNSIYVRDLAEARARLASGKSLEVFGREI